MIDIMLLLLVAGVFIFGFLGLIACADVIRLLDQIRRELARIARRK